MKLEYLAGAGDHPLIRLYDFTPAQAVRLQAALLELASGAAERVEVHRLAWVARVGGCRLTLFRQTWDQAIVQRAEPADFECGFTAATWDNVAGLLEPFAQGAVGFQWLAGMPGEAALLLSVTGQW
jgi:hypothetical protein